MSVSAQTLDDEISLAALDGNSAAVDVVRRILLVDEQAHVLRVIRLNLERCGYMVDAVLNGELALQHARVNRYDALIMTSDLPDMTSGRLYERAQDLLDGFSPELQSPLILVGHDQDANGIVKTDYCEPLSRPVSLKLIIARLGKHFEVSACHAEECH